MTQPDLFLRPIDAEFRRFHSAHPEVYQLFVRFAEQAKRSNARRVGAKAIAERIRWECAVERTGDYVVNNTFVSRYARLVASERPDLADLFETRRLKS